MIFLSIGRREQGKTTLAYYFAKKRATRVIFDPRKAFGGESHPDATGLFEELDTAQQINIQPRFDVPKVFEETCREIVAWTEENPEEPFAFLIDEARFIKTPDYIPPYFDQLLRFSNRRNLDILLTAHRPVDISVDIRAISDYWCMFKTTQEHDLKIIAERCGQGVADQVAALSDFNVIIWNDALGIWSKITDPARWNVSIGGDKNASTGERQRTGEASNRETGSGGEAAAA